MEFITCLFLHLLGLMPASGYLSPLVHQLATYTSGSLLCPAPSCMSSSISDNFQCLLSLFIQLLVYPVICPMYCQELCITVSLSALSQISYIQFWAPSTTPIFPTSEPKDPSVIKEFPTLHMRVT